MWDRTSTRIATDYLRPYLPVYYYTRVYIYINIYDIPNNNMRGDDIIILVLSLLYSFALYSYPYNIIIIVRREISHR